MFNNSFFIEAGVALIIFLENFSSISSINLTTSSTNNSSINFVKLAFDIVDSIFSFNFGESSMNKSAVSFGNRDLRTNLI